MFYSPTDNQSFLYNLIFNNRESFFNHGIFAFVDSPQLHTSSPLQLAWSICIYFPYFVIKINKYNHSVRSFDRSFSLIHVNLLTFISIYIATIKNHTNEDKKSIEAGGANSRCLYEAWEEKNEERTAWGKEPQTWWTSLKERYGTKEG